MDKYDYYTYNSKEKFDELFNLRVLFARRDWYNLRKKNYIVIKQKERKNLNYLLLSLVS
jgi:hypothetical protein